MGKSFSQHENEQPVYSPRLALAEEHVENTAGDGNIEGHDRPSTRGGLQLREMKIRPISDSYTRYFNTERPHQGIGQVPTGSDLPANTNGRIVRVPVLGGLHHVYRRAA